MAGKVIGVASIKGGVAKTATAIDIAAALSYFGHQVLVVDLDAQCDLSESVGVPVRTQYEIEQEELKLSKEEKRTADPAKMKTIPTIFDVLTFRNEYHETICQTKWFDLLPGDPELYMSDTVFTKRDDVYLLADLCDALRNLYDFIIIDSHPAKNILLNMLYVASDYVIASTLADECSMNGVESLESDLRDMRESRNKLSHAYILAVILARYKVKDLTCVKAMETLQTLLPKIEGSPFLETVKDSNRVSMARTMHMPLQEYEKYNNAAVDYRRIAKKIAEVCINGKNE